MDPFILAQASQMVEQSRQELLQEACQHVEIERDATRAEARLAVEQIHSEASRVVHESQSQVAQTQVEASQVIQMASNEVEMIRRQAREETDRLRHVAQTHISNLEGRMSELMRMNESMRVKVEEQRRIIETLTARVDDQNRIMARMQSEAMRYTHDANNGAEFVISTPVHQHSVNPTDTGPGVSSSVQLPLFSYAQDAVPERGAEPFGSASGVWKGSPKVKESSSKHSKGVPSHVGSQLNQIREMIQNIEHSFGKPSSKPSSKKSSSSSESSKSSDKGGDPGGSDRGSPSVPKGSSSSSSS